MITDRFMALVLIAALDVEDGPVEEVVEEVVKVVPAGR
jgi:hypothetical protein